VLNSDFFLLNPLAFKAYLKISRKDQRCAVRYTVDLLWESLAAFETRQRLSRAYFNLGVCLCFAEAAFVSLSTICALDLFLAEHRWIRAVLSRVLFIWWTIAGFPAVRRQDLL